MKKIIINIQLALLLFIAINANGQLPLNFGDGIITHSPNSYTASGPTTSPAVVRVIHTSNTTSAFLGSAWGSPPKPLNDFYPNWNVNILGYVFGITLDENTNPNIYVSSTQIYNSSTLNMRKVWRLNGSTGSNSLVFDFNNPSGVGTNTSIKSLGNLKYGKFGTTENIYVSDWQTGEIHRLTGNSTGTALWANQPPYNPKFGKINDDPTEMPYGIAIRRISATVIKLYYSKISTNNNSNSIGGYGNNEIYSIDINPVNGAFISGSETVANVPNINRNPNSWLGYTGSGISYTCSILPVISDIAFTTNGNKMLVGQQSWGVFGFLAPHNSEVWEFVNSPLLSTAWINSPNLFPSGATITPLCTLISVPSGYFNATGGVSYSNNVLRNNLNYGCDTSVYFTTDYISVSAGAYVYGVQGMNANGGASNSLSNSIWIDADDNYNYYDKTFLGDVEIYKNPTICATPCDCGKWDSIGLNNNGQWWPGGNNPLPTISFNQGQTSGVLFPHYSCSGTNCNATYTYSLTYPTGNNITLQSSNGGLNLNQQALNSLPCGTYFLNITPQCGNTQCPPIRITLNITCFPICACKGTVTINANPQSFIVTPQTNIPNPNPVSVVSGNFTLTSSMPVTEVRMLVDEFRIVTKKGNENCMLCKNKPQTWGSINNANLSGVALQTLITPMLTNDIREFIFNNGPNTQFNLSGNTLTFSIGLPGVTGLDCCNLQIAMCIKFIVRDTKCCETEVLKCVVFDLK